MPCIVCGDKAQGINFNVLTCTSCKTFFRRNAFREKELKCNFDNSCSISLLTRKFCTKCRLQKCFDVGMQKELIQKGKLNTVNRMQFIINHLRNESNIPQLAQYEQITEFQQNNSNSDSSSLTSLPSSPASNFTDSIQSNDSSIQQPDSVCDNIEPYFNIQQDEFEDDEFITQTFDSLTEKEIQELKIFKEDLTNYLTDQNTNSELIDLIENCQQIENLQNIQKFYHYSCTGSGELKQTEIQHLKHQNLDYITQCLLETNHDDYDDEFYTHDPIMNYIFQIKHKNSIYPEIYLPTHELMSGEANVLKDLINACEVLKNPYKQFRHVIDFQIDHPNKVSLFTFQRLIQMSSQLNSFAQLSASDQATILQLNLFDMLAVQLVLMFVPEQDCLGLVDDKNKITALVPFGHFKPMLNNFNNFERHRRFFDLFREEWKSDDVIFYLLTAIVLFNPRKEFYDFDMIKNQHVGYVRLLNRYLTLKYPQPEEANASFSLLMSNLEELSQICVDTRKMFHDKFRIGIQSSPMFVELLRASKIQTMTIVN